MPQAGANLNNDVIVQVYLPTSYTKDLLEMCKDRRKKVALGSSGMFDDGIYNTVFKRQHTEERGEMADAQQSA
ncbi:hypothetical protein D910_02888, partial [Dendroctonus ponderosae]